MPFRDKSKVAKALLEKEEGGKSDVSVGQMRAAEEEQRMGRRGIDEGKKKKIPSDPVEHIRTLYGPGKPNERVKKARKRLYDRYVEQGKLEPVSPATREKIFAGEKVKVHKMAGGRKEYGYDYPEGHDEQKGDKWAEEWRKESYAGSEVLKRSWQARFEAFDKLVEREISSSQKRHEFIQEQRLKYPSIADAEDAFHSELVDWRKKHKKPLSPRNY